MPSPSVRVRNQSAPKVKLMWRKVIIKGLEPQLSKIAEIEPDGIKKISGWNLHDSSTKNPVPHTIGFYVGGVLKVVVYPAEILPFAEIIIRKEGNGITVWGLKQTLSDLFFRFRGRGDEENQLVRIGINYQPPPLEKADLNPLSPRSTLATCSSPSSDGVIRSASSPSSPLSAFATPTAYASPCSDVAIRSASSYSSPLSAFGTSTAYASPCSDVEIRSGASTPTSFHSTCSNAAIALDEPSGSWRFCRRGLKSFSCTTKKSIRSLSRQFDCLLL